ncbi:glycosyltransferase family 2 protein [Natrononativus amylolyticus]|uniref:glycosyltransferase family 2 protein n=1 Tax=Natrononativus amylolyticus TaxID=2963434 RepID=UPI0020CE01BA|nr:glycosyltransferase family 2 protein [Natrononativus amylolyticus]
MPTVSVVIPTYNREEILPRAIDSVLAQTYDDWELLVVDDGSSDDTVDVVRSYEDDRVRCLEHETNQGANAARNTGIDEVEGEYVAFLDSDDAWDETKLEKQLDALEAKPDDENWVAAYCGFEINAAGSGWWLKERVAAVLALADEERPMEGGEELIGEVLADNVHSGAGSTLIVETDVAREIGGFDEELERFQDPEFLLRILEVGKVAYVDEPLVTRFETPVPDAETIERADEQYLGTYADTVEALEAEGYEIRAAHNLVLAKLFLREGELAKGVGYLRHSTASPRHGPGLTWATAQGLRGRGAPAVAGAAALAAVAAVVWFRR